MINDHLPTLGLRLEAAESRIASRLAARLNESAQALPHDIGERLRVSREQAVRRASAARRTSVAPAVQVQVQGSGSLVLGGPPSVWLRLASVLPLIVLVAGLVLVQQRHDADQINAAAEVDAALLADDLPPDAYSDPGFSEFLKAMPQP
jgi:Protein of unknown function (DUF3619)